MASLLKNEAISMKSTAGVYEKCVRSVMIHGAEMWPFTKGLCSFQSSSPKDDALHGKDQTRGQITLEEESKKVACRILRFVWISSVFVGSTPRDKKTSSKSANPTSRSLSTREDNEDLARLPAFHDGYPKRLSEYCIHVYIYERVYVIYRFIQK